MEGQNLTFRREPAVDGIHDDIQFNEYIPDGEQPSKEAISEYKWCRLGVESTRRDLEYCLSLELAEIMDP